MKKGKKAYRAMGLVLLFLLILLNMLNLKMPDRAFSEEENRMLAGKPALTLSGLLDGSFMKQFETYETDQFAYRDGWNRVRTTADRVLGKKESGGVYLGKNGQLYEKPAAFSDAVSRNLDAMRSFGERHGELNSYVLLVPNAAGVQKEGLPPFAPVEDQEAQLEAMNAYLGDALKPISVYETLREKREEYLYYRSDHHWTTLGAFYAFSQAAEVMELPERQNPLTSCALTNNFLGTLSSRSGYQVTSDTISVYWPEREEELVVTYVEEQKKSASLYATEKLSGKDQYGVFLNGNHPLVQIRTMAEGGRRLLILKDSYANCFVPFLTEYFEEIVLVDPRYYYGDLEQLLKEKEVTDVLFLYNLNTFLGDRVLYQTLEESTGA